MLVEYCLSHRVQRVVINGLESEQCDIESVVLLGSVLVPFLFLVYGNDEQGILSSINSSADDTSL